MTNIIVSHYVKDLPFQHDLDQTSADFRTVPAFRMVMVTPYATLAVVEETCDS